ncbi:hypothetical protein D3C73_839010 [compost metagenome]
MERLQRQREARGAGADLVARQQRATAVEQGVFQGLGRQRRGQLLEAAQGQGAGVHHGIIGLVLSGHVLIARVLIVHVPIGLAPRRAAQPFVNLFQQAGVGGGVAQRFPRLVHRNATPVRIGRAAPPVFRIAAVHGKHRQQRRQHAVNGRAGPVARAQVEAGDVRQRAHQRLPFGGEMACQHAVARVAQLGSGVAWVATKRYPATFKLGLRFRRMQQRAHLVHEVVAGGALGGPARVQRFVVGQDFFNDQVGAAWQAGLFALAFRLP